MVRRFCVIRPGVVLLAATSCGACNSGDVAAYEPAPVNWCESDAGKPLGVRTAELLEPRSWVTDTYDGFGIVVQVLDEGYVSLYRAGRSHATDSGKILRRTSADGLAWSEPVVLFSHSILDYRNLAGGISRSGELFLWWSEYDWHSQTGRLLKAKSPDGGRTWSAPEPVPGASFAYGPLVEQDGWVGIVAETTGGHTQLLMWDQHEDWKSLNISSAAVARMPTYEVALVALDDWQLLGFGRDEFGRSLLRVYSSDRGNTWEVTATELPVRPPTAGSEIVRWSQVSPWLTRSGELLILWYAERSVERPLSNRGALCGVLLDPHAAIKSTADMPCPDILWETDYTNFGYPSVAGNLVQWFSQRETGAQNEADIYTAEWRLR